MNLLLKATGQYGYPNLPKEALVESVRAHMVAYGVEGLAVLCEEEPPGAEISQPALRMAAALVELFRMFMAEDNPKRDAELPLFADLEQAFAASEADRTLERMARIHAAVCEATVLVRKAGLAK